MTEVDNTPIVSSSPVTIRPAIESDAAAICSIYNHYVTTSTATFDLETRTLEQQEAWLGDRKGALAALVAEHDGSLVGFASLSPYKDRAAYRTTVEDSIYLDPNAQGLGIGRALLAAIIDVARRHGFHALIARVNASLDASIGLHEALGFERVGIEREVGRKFNKWHDVMILQLLLPLGAAPHPE